MQGTGRERPRKGGKGTRIAKLGQGMQAENARLLNYVLDAVMNGCAAALEGNDETVFVTNDTSSKATARIFDAAFIEDTLACVRLQDKGEYEYGLAVEFTGATEQEDGAWDGGHFSVLGYAMKGTRFASRALPHQCNCGGQAGVTGGIFTIANILALRYGMDEGSRGATIFYQLIPNSVQAIHNALKEVDVQDDEVDRLFMTLLLEDLDATVSGLRAVGFNPSFYTYALQAILSNMETLRASDAQLESMLTLILEPGMTGILVRMFPVPDPYKNPENTPFMLVAISLHRHGNVVDLRREETFIETVVRLWQALSGHLTCTSERDFSELLHAASRFIAFFHHDPYTHDALIAYFQQVFIRDPVIPTKNPLDIVTAKFNCLLRARDESNIDTDLATACFRGTIKILGKLLESHDDVMQAIEGAFNCHLAPGITREDRDAFLEILAAVDKDSTTAGDSFSIFSHVREVTTHVLRAIASGVPGNVSSSTITARKEEVKTFAKAWNNKALDSRDVGKILSAIAKQATITGKNSLAFIKLLHCLHLGLEPRKNIAKQAATILSNMTMWDAKGVLEAIHDGVISQDTGEEVLLDIMFTMTRIPCSRWTVEQVARLFSFLTSPEARGHVDALVVRVNQRLHATSYTGGRASTLVSVAFEMGEHLLPLIRVDNVPHSSTGCLSMALARLACWFATEGDTSIPDTTVKDALLEVARAIIVEEGHDAPFDEWVSLLAAFPAPRTIPGHDDQGSTITVSARELILATAHVLKASAGAPGEERKDNHELFNHPLLSLGQAVMTSAAHDETGLVFLSMMRAMIASIPEAQVTGEMREEAMTFLALIVSKSGRLHVMFKCWDVFNATARGHQRMTPGRGRNW